MKLLQKTYFSISYNTSSKYYLLNDICNGKFFPNVNNTIALYVTYCRIDVKALCFLEKETSMCRMKDTFRTPCSILKHDRKFNIKSEADEILSLDRRLPGDRIPMRPLPVPFRIKGCCARLRNSTNIIQYTPD